MSITSDDLFIEIAKLPSIDTHTHIHAGHPTARGLDDILLYHMIISELYSAGCPDGARLSDDPSENERETRILNALPYIEHIQNTSCFWGVRMILGDLYDWHEPITAQNWREIDNRIREKSVSDTWVLDIMRKAGIQRTCTELWRGVDGRYDNVFQYSIEWAFFTRCQWGQCDTALLELEHAWNENIAGSPLPVTVDRNTLNFKKIIRSINDVDAAMAHYCRLLPLDKVLSTASHLSTDISYRRVSRDEMARALNNRENADVYERDVYANYIHETFLEHISKMENPPILQYSLGAEPLPFETGSKLRTETIFELANLFSRYPSLHFNLFNANSHQQQALNTIARELPNVSLSAYWWHNFFPTYIRESINSRLDMVPANKTVGFFSDAYCMDWAYAKSIIIKKQLASVMADKINQGQYTMESALAIAKTILFETPQTLLLMKPNIF